MWLLWTFIVVFVIFFLMGICGLYLNWQDQRKQKAYSKQLRLKDTKDLLNEYSNNSERIRESLERGVESILDWYAGGAIAEILEERGVKVDRSFESKRVVDACLMLVERKMELGQYASMTPKKKRVEMLKKEIKLVEEAIDSTYGLQVALMNSAYQEKERNWAAAGGLGGIGAALDAQIENIGIRARNEANQQAINDFASSTMQSARNGGYERERKLKICLEKAEKAKKETGYATKDLFDMLEFSDVKALISAETNKYGVEIKATIKVKKEMDLKKDSLVVDGKITANIFVGPTCVGSTTIVFPYDGITKKGTSVYGSCLCNPAIVGGRCRVEFVNDNRTSLCLIESPEPWPA